MGSKSLPFPSGSDVQLGWIYLKDEKNFYPPKEKQKFKTDETYVIEVKELPQDKFNVIVGKSNWQEEVKNLQKGINYKIIYCLLLKTVSMKPLQQENIDFQYVNKILYGYSTWMMIKYHEYYSISLDEIQYILNCNFKGSLVRNYVISEVRSKILTVNFYDGNENIVNKPFYSANAAFLKLADLMKNMRKNNKLEAFNANVSTLPLNATDNSKSKCLIKKEPRKSSRNKSIFRKFIDGVTHIFWPDYGQDDEEKESSVNKEVISLMNKEVAKLSEPRITTTCRDDYCNSNSNALNKNMGNENNKVLNSYSRSNFAMLGDNKKNETNYKDNVISYFNNNDDALNPKTFSERDVPKPAPRKHLADIQTDENLNDAIVAQPRLRDREAGTRSHDSNAISNCKASSKMMDAAIDKQSCVDKKSLDSSKDAKKTLSALKMKLQSVRRSNVESGLTHLYYYDESLEETGETFKKALLLFGSDDRGKLALLNLLFHCSQPDEKLKEGLIVDVASEVKSICFYHFLSYKASLEEVIVIITPKLTTLTLKNLKQLLSDGILNVNALGFVVNSRSEAMTSEERCFFHFIRSSFGEVSNHHLMTFLSYCDVSRNFPVLEEMKQLSIKSKCTLELYCCELILNDILEQDDDWSTLIPIELKKGKKVFKTLKDMPMLSVKSMKIAQEKSFAETHCADSFKQLVEELKQFTSQVKCGKDIKDNVKAIWRLARLVLTLERNESSEKNLLEFMTKVLDGIESDGNGSMNSQIFLLLLLNCPERNSTASLLSILDYYYELISFLYDNPDAPPPGCSVLTENNEVALFCNNCKDIHRCHRNTRDEDILYVKCLICPCPAKCHSLWTFQDSRIFSHTLCKAAITALRDLWVELPHNHLVIQFPLFLDCLFKAYPKYEMILKQITESNNLKKKEDKFCSLDLMQVA